MRESSSASAAQINRLALILLRAAAYLIVATGFNEIVSAAAPRYEPLYVYVVIAAVVTLVDGVLFGFPISVVATAVYVLLYTPRPLNLSSALWAGQIMATAMAVAAIVRMIWQLRRRDAAAEPASEETDGSLPMIEASVVTASDDLSSAVEMLRSELRAAFDRASESREREHELQTELREMRARLAESRDAEHALRMAAAGEAERIVAGAQRALDQVNARLQQAEENAREREARLEEAYRAARDAATMHIQQLERENAGFREAQRETSELASTSAARLAAVSAELAETAGRLEELRRDNAVLHARAAEEAERAKAATAAADQARAELELTRNQVARLKTDESTLRAAAEAAGEAVSRSDEMVQTLRSDLAAARNALERERATRVGLEEQFEKSRQELESELRRLSSEVADRTRDLETLRRSSESDRELLQALERDLGELTNVAEIERTARVAAEQSAATAASEAELARRQVDDARAEADAARVELAGARNEMDTLREEVEALRFEAAARADLATSAAADIAQRELESLRREAEETLATVAQLRVHNETLGEELRGLSAALDETQRERDAIAAELTSRAEAAERAAATEKNAAAAITGIADRLRMQLEATQQELDAARITRDSLERELRSARESMSGRSAVDEQVQQLRERTHVLEAEIERAASERSGLEERLADAEAVGQRLSLSLADERAMRLAAELSLTEARAAADGGAQEREQAARELAELRTSHDQALTVIEQLRSNLDATRDHMEASHRRIAELEDALRDAIAGASADDAGALREELEAIRASAARLEAARSDAEDRAEQLRVERDRLAERSDLLQQQLDALRSDAMSTQLQFDRKLQEIVAHLAEDHEADVGQAVMEREEARAEVRRLTAKLTSLQEAFEAERSRWLAARETLTRRIRQSAATELPAEERRVESVAPPAEVSSAPSPAVTQAATTAATIETSVPAVPHVLIAHPDLQLRELARERLEAVGYRVSTAADGLEGLRRAMSEQPDLVVADSSMPKMDGRELCQMLKSQERTARIKVVLLTHSAAELSSEPGLKPDEILRKPVRFELLRSSLASLLGQR